MDTGNYVDTLFSSYGSVATPPQSPQQNFVDHLFGQAIQGGVEQQERAGRIQNRIKDDAFGVRNDASLDSPERLSAAIQLRRKQVDSGASSADPLYWAKSVPVGGHVVGALQMADVWRASKRIEEGKASGQDYSILADFLVAEDAAQKRSTAQNVGNAVVGSVQFAGDLAATGGTSAAAGNAARGALMQAIGKRFGAKAVESLLARAAGAGVEMGANAAVRSAMPAMLPRVAEGAIDRSMETVSTDGAKLIKVRQGQNLAQSILESYLDTVVEVGAEMAGEKLVKLPGLLKGTKVGDAVTKLGELIPAKVTSAIQAINALGMKGDTARSLMKAIGKQNLLTEMVEERLGDVARGTLALDRDAAGNRQFGTTGKLLTDPLGKGAAALGEEAAVLGAIGGAGAVASRALPREAPIPEQRSPVPRVKATDLLNDADFAATWSAENREAATKLAALESPSRSQWAEITGFKVHGTPQHRQAFAENVRGALARRRPAGFEAEPLQDAGVRIDRDRKRRPVAPEPEPVEPIQTEGATVPAFPGEQLSRDWRQIDTSQPLPASGVEVYQDRHGQRFIRAVESSPPQDDAMNAPSGEEAALARRTALEAMSVGEVNQEASRYGLKKGPSKTKQIEKILAAEAVAPPVKPQPKPTVAAPMAATTGDITPSPVVQTRQLEMTTAPSQSRPSALPEPSQTPPASILPPEYAQQSDQELVEFLTVLGDKAPPKNPPKTFRARLEKKVAAIVGNATTQPSTPQDVPTAPIVPPEAPADVTANQPALDEEASVPPAERESAAARDVGSKPLDPKRKMAARRGLAKHFPGAKITEVAAEKGKHKGGFRVTLANGRHFDTLLTDKIAMYPEAVATSLRGKLGREPTQQEIDSVSAAGAFYINDESGKPMPGLGAMALAIGQFDDSTIRHEGLHLARRSGLFTDAEWAALKKKYAPSAANDEQAEEAIAYSTEAWSEPTLAERIKLFFSQILRGLGIELDARMVEVLMQSPEFWARMPQVEGPRQQAYARSLAERGPDDDMAKYDHVPFQVRPRANIGETGPVREFVEEQEATMQRPETRHDEDVMREADERLARHGIAPERKRIMAMANRGEQLNDTDTVVARRIFNAEAQEALRDGDAAKVLEAQKLLEAYRRTGTEQGRSFRHRRDWRETPDQTRRRSLAESVLTPPQKVQEQIDQAVKDKNHDEAERLRKKWAGEYDKLKKQLLLLGVDLDNLNAYGYDPVKTARAIATVQAAKADAWDKAYEFWRNSILSGPQTQVANALGTALHGGWKFLVERPLESAVNLAAQRKEGAQVGEFRHVAAGILPGLQRAARNAMIAWKTEMPELERQLEKDGEFRIEEPNVAIRGTKGRIIRMPQRAMLMADEFMKSFFATLDVGAQAYRNAKASGLTGAELQSAVAEQVNDLGSQAWSQAHDTALELAFQQKGTQGSQAIKKGLLHLRREVEVLGMKPLAFLFPFITTPVNIFETGMRKAPITGDLAAMKKMYDNWRAGRPIIQDMTPRIAERIVAWSTVLALSMLTGGDDQEPWITGTVATKDRGKRDMSRRTHPSQSIRIGNRWYSYARIEPLATALTLAVDWVNAGKEASKTGDTTALPTAPFASIAQQMKDKTFLDGVGDLMRVIEAPEPIEEVANWSGSFAVSWLPNIIRQPARALSDTFPERGVWGDGNEKAARLGKRVVQRTELGLIRDQPSIDVWGREAKRGTSPVYGTDIPWRILSPVESRVPELFEGDRALLNWNAQHPGDERFPVLPSRKFKVAGKDRSLSDEEYTQYLRLAGGIARSLVERQNINVEQPTEADIKVIEQAITDGRSRARESLAAQWTKGTTAPTVDALAGDVFDQDVAQKAEDLARMPPLKFTERRKWLRERQAALTWLKGKGVSKADVLRAVQPELAKIKTPKLRIAKRGRLVLALKSLE